MSTAQQITCPVCFYVYFKPINLPCGHILCQVCLERSMEEATLGCPICRRRLSSWRRNVTDISAYINKELEEKIQRLFPQYYSNKQKGLDATLCESESKILRDITNSPLPPVRLATPGSIRAEYEEAVAKASEVSVQEEADLAMSRYILLESVEDIDENINALESTRIEDATSSRSPRQYRSHHFSTNLSPSFSMSVSRPKKKKSLISSRRYDLRKKSSNLACSKVLHKRISAKHCLVNIDACLRYLETT